MPQRLAARAKIVEDALAATRRGIRGRRECTIAATGTGRSFLAAETVSRAALGAEHSETGEEQCSRRRPTALETRDTAHSKRK